MNSGIVVALLALFFGIFLFAWGVVMYYNQGGGFALTLIVFSTIWLTVFTIAAIGYNYQPSVFEQR